MRNRIGKIFLLMAMCFIVCGCSKKEAEEKEQADRTISRYEMPGLLGYCVDEAGEYLYCTVKGSSSSSASATTAISFIKEPSVPY